MPEAFTVDGLRRLIRNGFPLADTRDVKVAQRYIGAFDTWTKMAEKRLGTEQVFAIIREEAQAYQDETGLNPYTGGPAEGITL